MRALQTLLIAFLVIGLLGFGFVYSGMFNIAADKPHWSLTHRLIETLRERSIANGARSVAAPAMLKDPQFIAAGAQEYAEMCTGCHLAPGMRETELRTGLYPKPPNLAEHAAHRKPEETFWVIKHGLKMTGMPAWGLTHDDQRIWSMVAFLETMPGMSASQYRALTAQAGASGHSHEASGSMQHEGSERAGTPSHDEQDVASREGVGHTHEDSSSPQEHAQQAGASMKGMSHDQSEPSNEDTPSAAQSTRAGSPLSANTMEPVALVDRFFRSLAAGDTKSASVVLDPGVLIYESGSAERSREEYAAHHLDADAAFLKSAQHRLISRTGDAVGDLAWVATEARVTSPGAAPADVVSTETMILRKTAGGWRIVHIHWSSRSVIPK